MHGEIHEVGLHLLVLLLFDTHMRVPSPVAYGVASKPDRGSAGVSDAGGLFLEESVLAMTCQKYEETLKADVLEICCPCLLPPRPSPLRDVDPVTGDELL